MKIINQIGEAAFRKKYLCHTTFIDWFLRWKNHRNGVEPGAPTLLSNYPFCLTMFEGGIKGDDLEDALRSRTIAEVFTERLL